MSVCQGSRFSNGLLYVSGTLGSPLIFPSSMRELPIVSLLFFFFKTHYVHGRPHTGTYGTPPETRTDSGSGQLIVPTHRWLFTRSLIVSKLIWKVIKETLYPIYTVVRVIGLLVCHPYWVVYLFPLLEPCYAVRIASRLRAGDGRASWLGFRF